MGWMKKILPKTLGVLLGLFCIALLAPQVQAVTNVTITPQTMTQGQDWQMTWDLANAGNTGTIELWIDKNGNRLIDGGDTLLFAGDFTDGEPFDPEGGGPLFDADGLVNGSYTWHPSIVNFYINPAPGDYIVKIIDEDRSEARNWFRVNRLTGTRYSVSGRVTLPANTPYLWIQATYNDEVARAGYMYADFTDANGDYQIYIPNTLPNKTWWVGAGWEAPPGYLPPDNQGILINGHITGVNFAFIPTTASIKGTVKDDLGSPLSGIRISARERNSHRWTSTRTKDDGSYQLDVIAGTWRIEADVDRENYIPPRSIEVEIRDGEHITGKDIICYRVVGTIKGKGHQGWEWCP